MTSTNSTWKQTLGKSEDARLKGAKYGKQAKVLLWDGAKAAIEEWSDSNSDPSGEGLYNDVMEALGGTHRKGDASKVRTVAAALAKGLNLDAQVSLSGAYAEARRLNTETITAKAEMLEDAAAEDAVTALAPPKTASTAESAAQIVIAKGVDEAARLLLDALGADNTLAHRALLRAIGAEIAGRVKVEEKPEKKAPAPKKKGAAVKQDAPVKTKADKADAADDEAPKKAKAAPIRKAVPVKKAAPVEEAPVEEAPVEDAPVEEVTEAPAPVVTTNIGRIKRKRPAVRR